MCKFLVDEYPYWASDCPFCEVDIFNDDNLCRMDDNYCPLTNSPTRGYNKEILCGKLITIQDFKNETGF